MRHESCGWWQRYVCVHKSMIPTYVRSLLQANPSNLDRAEDLTDLVHLNEPSVVHVLRQRYANSLVHTYAGRHTIIINPIRQLASYSDKVCRVCVRVCVCMCVCVCVCRCEEIAMRREAWQNIYICTVHLLSS